MLVSVFTPTHDPSNLREVHNSLVQQTYPKWEWVLVPNGPAIGQIPEDIQADLRVKVHNYTDKNRNIGALKRYACEQATGDIFCELDHDDMLVPGILARVVDRVSAGAGFVFSDAAVFLPEQANTSVGYSEMSNWETYDIRVFGQDFLASRAFPITARSLCEVYYAPDHIRCWTRDAYAKTKGHDPDLKVGDDHDLICRTYLAQIPFAHTGGCGYLYRNYEGNSVKAFQQEIIDQQNANRDKYLHSLIAEWCRREGYPHVDLAEKGEQLIKADRSDVKIDAPSEHYGFIKAYGSLHNVPQPAVVPLMNELYRVLKPGGWLCVSVPSAVHESGFSPAARSYWSPHTFDYFCMHQFGMQIPGSLARFQEVRCKYYYPAKWHKAAECPYILADLCALKGQRQPGRVMI